MPKTQRSASGFARRILSDHIIYLGQSSSPVSVRGFRCLRRAVAQIAPADLDIAVFGQLTAAELCSATRSSGGKVRFDEGKATDASAVSRRSTASTAHDIRHDQTWLPGKP
jgi:hypothetical protein